MVRRKHAYVVRAALRDPGRGFGAPVTLEVPEIGEIDQLSVGVAIAPDGDALVAVRQNLVVKRRMHLFAFRRPAGGTFLPPQDVTGARHDLIPSAIGAGTDAEGKDILPLAIKGVDGAGKRSFRARLKHAAQARRVTVTAYGESDREPRPVTVRLR